ncbi:uncharacterized protein LOC125379952 [Haliotis rufescens]|uniref:uncharacterized protein LOC125379952 n=1 Tax=Haliotis rufescens TaxID=6454 RepID=UPI00201F742F|nr:uncharacterized protein LOC125379952 [Haliotis rufescens]
MGSSGSTSKPHPRDQTSSTRGVSHPKTDTKQAEGPNVVGHDNAGLNIIDNSQNTTISQTGDQQKQNGRSNLHPGEDCRQTSANNSLTPAKHTLLPPKGPRRPSVASGDFRYPPTRPHRPRTAPSRPKSSRSNSQRPTVRGRQISTRQLQKVDLFSRILHGDMSVECPFAAKIVRIFTSSTFTDTEHERNALMERVYPRLKERCRQLGYEFQVVDMRWGVRDEATDDHMTSDLCLLEIDLCMKLSTGPFFVTFLSHKYGYRPLPSQISSEEFLRVMSAVKKTEDKDLLYRWYLEDENADPPTYVLQPISSLLPDFLSEDGEHQLAKDTWYEMSDQMKMALEEAARETLEPRAAHRYVMSVTEQEIAHALFTSDNVAGRSAWFDRRLRDIDKSTDSPSSALYKYKGEVTTVTSYMGFTCKGI